MMFDQLALGSRFKFFNNDEPDEFSDRLSYKFSSFILYAIGGMILIKQYFTHTISCYLATDPGGSHLLDYIESYCLVNGIIPLSFNGTMPNNRETWKAAEKFKIVYYQWVPFVLLSQGLICYIPHTIWRLFYSTQKNKDFRHIIDRANNIIKTTDEKRTNEIIRLAKTLETMLFQNRKCEEKSTIPIKILKLKSYFAMLNKRGVPIIFFYIFVKLLYVGNSVGQIYLMQYFLNLDMQNYSFFGTKILHDIINGKDWQVSLVFPRIGFCFAKIRQMGVTNYLVAQCAIPFNMLNEKIYIFLWFWMVFLSIASLTSLIVWIIRALFSKSKTDFIKMYLKLSGDYTNRNLNTAKLKKFENYFLRHDGMFLLRMMASSAGDLIAAEVLSQLWKIYTPQYEVSQLDVEKLSNCIIRGKEFCQEDLTRENLIKEDLTKEDLSRGSPFKECI